jgi:hypothetical protein
MSYQKEIIKHFKLNKEKLFGEIENGKWRNSEKIYSHILPVDNKNLNLLLPYRTRLEKYLEKNEKEIKKHIYFHHLNSSQAMCLNFFYPLIKEQKIEVILKMLGFENEEINYKETCFEKASEIERKHYNYRPTSFDFYIETVSGKKFYFEIKYTEQEFGKAKYDEIHIRKFNEVYKMNLDFITDKYCDVEAFLKNYQILRNLICISENSYVIFLYPSKNKKVKSQAEYAKEHFIKTEISNHQRNLTWEYVLNYVETNVEKTELKLQFKNFKEKYNL